MAKASCREKILTEGMRVLHQRGYNGASVRDIIEAAEVPLGSFTNHFKSKEAFALEVLNLYFERNGEPIRKTLLNESMPPLKRIKAYIEATDGALNQDDNWAGCLLGNFSIEASDHSEALRKRTAEINREIEQAIASSLKAAVKTGDLPKNTDCTGLSAFILSSMHGAYLQTRVDRNSTPIERFKKFLFSNVLR